jgi:hypothetical protein
VGRSISAPADRSIDPPLPTWGTQYNSVRRVEASLRSAPAMMLPINSACVQKDADLFACGQFDPFEE